MCIRDRLIQGNGERRLSRLATSTPPYETVTMELHDGSGRLLAHREDIRKSYAWGYEIISTTLGTGTCVAVTSNDFYTTSSEIREDPGTG